MASLRAYLELFLWHIKGLFLWPVWRCFYGLLRGDFNGMFGAIFRAWLVGFMASLRASLAGFKPSLRGYLGPFYGIFCGHFICHI